MKDKTSHVSSAVYKEKYNCGERYSCETGRNFTIRGNGHSDNGKNSEPEKHLYQFPEHRFNW